MGRGKIKACDPFCKDRGRIADYHAKTSRGGKQYNEVPAAADLGEGRLSRTQQRAMSTLSKAKLMSQLYGGKKHLSKDERITLQKVKHDEDVRERKRAEQEARKAAAPKFDTEIREGESIYSFKGGWRSRRASSSWRTRPN